MKAPRAQGDRAFFGTLPDQYRIGLAEDLTRSLALLIAGHSDLAARRRLLQATIDGLPLAVAQARADLDGRLVETTARKVS